MYIIFIDLDGTLLRDDNTVSDYTKRIIRQTIENGNIIVFMTARSGRLAGISDDVKNLTDKYILHNGGEIIASGINRKFYFSREETEKIGCFLTENKIKTAVILDNAYYANYDVKEVWGDIEKFQFTDFQQSNFCAPKFSIINECIQANMLMNFGKVTYIDEQKNIILSPFGIDKGNAIKEYLKEADSVEYRTICIGNDINDISGFDMCDISVAVSNGDSIVIERADFITSSNDEDGVAKWLEGYMLNEFDHFEGEIANIPADKVSNDTYT